MTFGDHGRLGQMLRQQYRYLNTFADQVASGAVDLDRALKRAELYIDASRNAYERGHAVAWGVALPVYPGVHPNCHCSWSISEHGTGSSREVRAYWRTHSSNPCPECIGYRDTYSPLKIPMPV